MARKLAILITVCLLPFALVAQISFEKGFFVDSDGTRIACYIKNPDWKNNPTSFEYKLSEDGESKTKETTTVREFGIENFSRYVTVKTKIDRSPDELNDLTYDRIPVWSEETLPLKVVVDGDGILYQYQHGTFERFFFSVSGSSIQQLVYKKFLVADNTVGINSDFRSQLRLAVKCGPPHGNPNTSISYSSRSLARYFNQYNECKSGKTLDLSGSKKRAAFHLLIKSGIDVASLTVGEPFVSGTKTINFGRDTNFRLGLAGEFVLPWNKNKWAISVEPTFQQYSGVNTKPSSDLPLKVSYRSIEIPVGLRYYFFLNPKTRIFVNGFVVPDIVFHEQITFDDSNHLYAPLSVNAAFGAGLSYGRISVEFRYYTPRQIIGALEWYSSYEKGSAIVGIRLF